MGICLCFYKNSSAIGAIVRYGFGNASLFFAGILLIPLAFFCKIRLPHSRDLSKFAISGILGYTAYMFFFNTASTMISPSTASVINAVCPGLTAVFAYFLFSEKYLGKEFWVCLFPLLEFSFFLYGMPVFSQHRSSIYVCGSYLPLHVQYQPKVLCTKIQCYGNYDLLSIGRKFLFVPLPWKILVITSPFISTNVEAFNISCHVSKYSFLLLLGKSHAILSKNKRSDKFYVCHPYDCYSVVFSDDQELPTWSSYFGGALILSGMILFQMEKIKK